MKFVFSHGEIFYETKKTLSTDTLNLAAPDTEEEKLPIN